MKSRRYRLLRVLRGEAPEIDGTKDFFDKLCVLLRDSIAEEDSNPRVCKIIACEWILSEFFRIDDIDEIDEALEGSEMAEDDDIVFIDTADLAIIDDPIGWKLIGAVTDPVFEWAAIHLWTKDGRVAVSAAV